MDQDHINQIKGMKKDEHLKHDIKFLEECIRKIQEELEISHNVQS